MKIALNQDTGTIDITVSQDQISDDLLGVLPEPTTTTAEGCLTWSIRFGDVRRVPRNTSEATDELLGTVGAIVGAISSQGRASSNVLFGPAVVILEAISSQGRTSSVEAEGKIRGTLILTLNNSAIAEASGSLPTIKRLQDEFAAELSATESQPISLGSNSVYAQSGLQTIPLWLSNNVGVSNMGPLLFANPFS
jgi:hypothetical protein